MFLQALCLVAAIQKNKFMQEPSVSYLIFPSFIHTNMIQLMGDFRIEIKYKKERSSCERYDLQEWVAVISIELTNLNWKLLIENETLLIFIYVQVIN